MQDAEEQDEAFKRPDEPEKAQPGFTTCADRRLFELDVKIVGSAGDKEKYRCAQSRQQPMYSITQHRRAVSPACLAIASPAKVTTHAAAARASIGRPVNVLPKTPFDIFAILLICTSDQQSEQQTGLRWFGVCSKLK